LRENAQEIANGTDVCSLSLEHSPPRRNIATAIITIEIEIADPGLACAWATTTTVGGAAGVIATAIT